MKKNKSYKYIILVIILLILGSYLVFSKIEKNSINFNFTKQETIINKETPAENEVTLTTQNKTYTIQIKNGNTVYDAMNILKNTKGSNFTFNYKEYPSLGIFIDSINNVEGTPNKYWIYYINNKEASIGVSKYVLKSGDAIFWKQGEF